MTVNSGPELKSPQRVHRRKRHGWHGGNHRFGAADAPGASSHPLNDRHKTACFIAVKVESQQNYDEIQAVYIFHHIPYIVHYSTAYFIYHHHPKYVGPCGCGHQLQADAAVDPPEQVQNVLWDEVPGTGGDQSPKSPVF